ncbi:transposase [Pseudomonas lini]|uniref:transposase n=1 Tax=Pseudomonas lini TaxID=163011 RepID=UPI000A4DC7E5
MGYRVVTSEEKAEAIRLVVEMHYSVPKACEATGVGPTALRRWVYVGVGSRTEYRSLHDCRIRS